MEYSLREHTLEEFILEVLKLFEEDNDLLWWRVDNEYAPITFLVECHDTFEMAYAESEPIEEADLCLLKHSKLECEHLDIYKYVWPVWFVAQKRNMQPLKAYLDMYPEAVKKLFAQLPENTD